MNAIYRKHRIVTEELDEWVTALTTEIAEEDHLLAYSQTIVALRDEEGNPVQYECDLIYSSADHMSQEIQEFQVWVDPEDAVVFIQGMAWLYKEQFNGRR